MGWSKIGNQVGLQVEAGVCKKLELGQELWGTRAKAYTVVVKGEGGSRVSSQAASGRMAQRASEWPARWTSGQVSRKPR